MYPEFDTFLKRPHIHQHQVIPTNKTPLLEVFLPNEIFYVLKIAIKSDISRVGQYTKISFVRNFKILFACSKYRNASLTVT